jgi:hypothetical protein
MCGPSAVVVLEPESADHPQELEAVWRDVSRAGDFNALVRNLMKWGVGVIPDLILFIENDSLRCVVRNRLLVRDAETGAVVADGQTGPVWRHAQLHSRNLRIDLEPLPDKPRWLPVAMSKVGAAAIAVDARQGVGFDYTPILYQPSFLTESSGTSSASAPTTPPGFTTLPTPANMPTPAAIPAPMPTTPDEPIAVPATSPIATDDLDQWAAGLDSVAQAGLDLALERANSLSAKLAALTDWSNSYPGTTPEPESVSEPPEVDWVKPLPTQFSDYETSYPDVENSQPLDDYAGDSYQGDYAEPSSYSSDTGYAADGYEPDYHLPQTAAESWYPHDDSFTAEPSQPEPVVASVAETPEPGEWQYYENSPEYQQYYQEDSQDLYAESGGFEEQNYLSPDPVAIDEPVGYPEDRASVALPDDSDSEPLPVAEPLAIPEPAPQPAPVPEAEDPDFWADDVESTGVRRLFNRKQRQHSPVEAIPAPTQVVLAISDGQEIPMDSAVLIGRAPRPDAGDQARPIKVVSPHHDVSRNHVRIEPAVGGVLVTDQNSTNGTVVRTPGSPSVVAAAGKAVLAQVGSLISLGDGVVIRVQAEN